MFGKKEKQPSGILLDYIEGKGCGDEIDDYIHSDVSEEEEREVVAPLLEINRIYSNKEYFIGISNPESFASIRALAVALRKMGL